MSTTSRGPSRRTLVKGAAWSVPVVAMAQPVMAQDVVCSPNNTDPECNPVTPPAFTPGSACKFSGASCDGWKHAYRAQFCMTNTTSTPITVNITEIRVNGQAKAGIPSSVVVPATGVPFCFYTLANDTGSSANGSLSFDWNYTYVNEFGEEIYRSGTAGTGEQNDLPPCPDCNTGGYPGPGSKTAVTESAPADVKVDEAPASADVATTDSAPAPAPAAPVEPAPAPAPGDGASETATP